MARRALAVSGDLRSSEVDPGTVDNSCSMPPAPGEAPRHDPCSGSSVSPGVKSVRRPLSTRGILGLILLALALPVIALGLSVPILVQRRWERMQAECRTQEAELRARDPRRPVLRGEAVQGDAWEVYARAFKQLLAAGIPYQDFDYIDHPELIDSESLQVV